MKSEAPGSNLNIGTRVELGGGVAWSASMVGPGKTGPNEDSVDLIPCGENAAILVVADGLGGQAAGDAASQLAVQAIRAASPDGVKEDEQLRAAILNGFEQANEAVQKLAVGAATTLAVVEIRGRSLRPYHAGDSMILVVGQRGRIKLQSVAHSPVGYMVEAGVLDEGEAMHHADRHVVSNVVGTSDMRIEVGAAIDLAPHDTLLLASDGLMDNLYVHEVVDIIRTGPLSHALDELVAIARRRMTTREPGMPSKPDDMSIVLFRLLRSLQSKKDESPGDGE